MTDQNQSNVLKTPSDRLTGMSAYIEGKMKRYSLMFAVNGGAFVIAKLFADQNTKDILGGLSPRALAIGAVMFTLLMWRDIYLFGDMMKREFFDGKLVFQRPGILILHALCSLVIIGWLLAAFWPHGGTARPSGTGNESQPIRSDTNGTSSAAGSHR